MDERREGRAGFFDQPNGGFTEQAERAFAADKQFGKIEAASCKPIGETEEIVATTVLADSRTFLGNQRGIFLKQRLVDHEAAYAPSADRRSVGSSSP